LKDQLDRRVEILRIHPSVAVAVGAAARARLSKGDQLEDSD
jgi:hypothetical protein